MSTAPIHDALKPISWLAGRWKTVNGQGSYPTIEDFSYHEILEFNSVGQPMFNFLSMSTHPEKQTPMHQERGFLRIRPGTNELTFLVSHNFGVTSVEEGTYHPDTKEVIFKTISVNRMSFAKPPHVRSFQRKLKLILPDTLEVILSMETDRTELTEHLKAVYKKEEDA